MSEIKDIPKHWETKKLGEVCGIVYGKGLPVKELKPSGFPVFGANGIIGFNDKYLFEEPQVLISCRGAASGKINLSPPKCYVTNNSLVLDIKEKNKLDKTYLFYALNIAKKTKLVTGTAQPQVTINNAVDLDICYPPLPEQQAIVAKIEELLSELENGKQQLLTAQQQLKIYRQSLLKWAFEGKLTNKNVKEGELPKGWKLAKLGEYIENINSGKSYRCDERPPYIDEVGIIKVSSVTWGFFDEMESKTCFSKDLFNANYLIKKGDFLFSRANTIEFIGACVIVKKVNKKLMLSDKILRFTFSQDVLKEYVLYYLRSRKGRKQIEVLSTGNQDSMRNIGQEKIRQIEFPYCPLNEQQFIVSELESKLTVCDKIEETISQSLQQAETLRQSILKMAFEGRLI
ncbi:MAG: restriction endonuclease subunit S [Bacteroidota bacterium]|nr:restriction endonuclease subunit S [Bacteroidota bacterium]